MTRPRAARAIVLGAGAGGGVPQWNCDCRVCAMARAGGGRVEPATQASLALTGDGVDWVVVNASPDIRQQLAATPDLHPRPGRISPVTDVILTGGEIDQIAGLLTLREGATFRLHAADPVLADLAANPIFDVLRPERVERHRLAVPSTVTAASLVIECVAIAGKAPLYREGEDPVLGRDSGDTIGLLVTSPSGRRLAYVPGCAAVTPALQDLLGRADVVLLDGTLFRDDELVASGLGSKTGRRMGHLPIAGEGGTLDLLRSLAPRRRLYTHLNNSNPALVADSPERRLVEEAGIEIAHDGLEIAL